MRWTNEKPSKWGLSCAMSGSPFIRDWLTDIPTIFAHVFPLFSTPAALVLYRQHLRRCFLTSGCFLPTPENQCDHQNHGLSPIAEIQMIGWGKNGKCLQTASFHALHEPLQKNRSNIDVLMESGTEYPALFQHTTHNPSCVAVLQPLIAITAIVAQQHELPDITSRLSLPALQKQQLSDGLVKTGHRWTQIAQRLVEKDLKHNTCASDVGTTEVDVAARLWRHRGVLRQKRVKKRAKWS